LGVSKRDMVPVASAKPAGEMPAGTSAGAPTKVETVSEEPVGEGEGVGLGDGELPVPPDGVGEVPGDVLAPGEADAPGEVLAPGEPPVVGDAPGEPLARGAGLPPDVLEASGVGEPLPPVSSSVLPPEALGLGCLPLVERMPTGLGELSGLVGAGPQARMLRVAASTPKRAAGDRKSFILETYPHPPG
jgi:hypothetical protein